MHRRDFLHRAGAGLAAFGVLRSLGTCRPAQSPPDSFTSLRDRYFVRNLELNPVVATYLGGDGYSSVLAGINGRLRDFRPEALQGEATFYRGIRAELGRQDGADLSPRDRIDARVLAAQLDFLLHQLEEIRHHQRCIDTYVAQPFQGVDWQIQQMQAFPDGLLGTEDEWNLVVERARAVPAFLQTAAANLRAGQAAGNPPDRRMVELDGIGGGKANAEYFAATLAPIAARYLGGRPFARTLVGRLEQAGAAAARAYRDFARTLETTFDRSESGDRFAAGVTEYEWRLKHCLNLQRSAAELYEYGAAQVAVYQSRMLEVAREIARDAKLGVEFSSDRESPAVLRRVLEHLSSDSPADDDELLRWYREAGERAVAYGRERRLFDIPADYRLEVVPTPPVLRSAVDATYYPAPPFKKSGVGRFYLTPTGNDPAELRLNNRSSVADTAVHEGFPGHDWHFKYMTQHAGEISNIRWLTPGSVEDSSAMWQDSMATEGWALYCEELMAAPVEERPHGFFSAGEHLYQLKGQLLRAVRVRVDVGLHTGRISFDQAVDYFTEHADFLPGACAQAATDAQARAVCEGARRAIYRYSKWPTQAVTYNLGMNQILELRDTVRARQGDQFSAREFHERLMRMGTIPQGYYKASF